MASSATTSNDTAAQSSADPSPTVAALQAEVAELKQQLDWFKRQLFGPKSEKRPFEDPQQLGLGDILSARKDTLPESPKQTVTYERGKGAKKRGEDCVNDSGLRFDDSVPVKTITCPVLELNGLSPDEYEIVDIKRSFKLAQRPASYEVL